MRVSQRRAAVHCLTAFAFAAAALTGCSGGDDGTAAATEPATPATPSAPASAPASSPAGAGGEVPAEEEASPTGPSGGADQDDDASAPADAAPWAGTKQFVQIEDAWADGGQTYLSVRPAQKEAMTEPHEAWVVIPGEGLYTTVPMAEEARVLLSAPLSDAQASSHSPAEFVTRLTDLRPSIRLNVGYDLSFDGEGHVIRLQSLYTS